MGCCSHPSSGIRGRQINPVACIFHMLNVHFSIQYMFTQSLCVWLSLCICLRVICFYICMFVFLCLFSIALLLFVAIFCICNTTESPQLVRRRGLVMLDLDLSMVGARISDKMWLRHHNILQVYSHCGSGSTVSVTSLHSGWSGTAGTRGSWK